MPNFLPDNLLALFIPRPPLEYLPPATELLVDLNEKRPPITGIAQYIAEFEDTVEKQPETLVETNAQKKARRQKQNEELKSFKLEQAIALWNPAENAKATRDPYKTLFVSRLNYETSESKLKREFEKFGRIERLHMVYDKDGKPRGYAFIEYVNKDDMRAAYKKADGMKLDGRRIVVDYERGRTQKSWLPRRLGGGKGDTRRTKESRAELLSKGFRIDDRDRRDYRSGSRGCDRERDRDRDRERDRDRDSDRRRSRSRDRNRDRDRREESYRPTAPSRFTMRRGPLSADESDVVWSLCEKLRSERLLVSNELEAIVQLHTQIADRMIELGINEWSSQQQQLTFKRLLHSHELVKPETTCSLIDRMNVSKWTEAHQRLGYHSSSFEALLRLFSESPRATAEFLNGCETLTQNESMTTEEVMGAIFSMVYGHCIFPSDERRILDVLKYLIDLQVVPHPNPRLSIRKGTSAFCCLYKLFTENLFSAKVFLTSALHDPVMLVLCQDEIFLDIDPAKSPLRFPTAERQRLFGVDPESAEYQAKTAKHRKIIQERLVQVAHAFVKGISDSLVCFPTSLTWLVQQMYKLLIDVGRTRDQAKLICTDLVVTNLLCPAITNPESLGIISDTPIGRIPRFNLMQMGQLIQTLVLLKYEQPSPNMQFLSSHFKESSICDLVGNLLNRSLPELDAMFTPVITSSNDNEELLRRTYFLGSLHEINSILCAVRSSATEMIKDGKVSKSIKEYVKRMPAFFSTPINQAPLQNVNGRRGTKMRQLTEKVQSARNLLILQRTPSANEVPIPTIELPPEYFDIVVFRLNVGDELLGLKPENKFIEGLTNANVAETPGKMPRLPPRPSMGIVTPPMIPPRPIAQRQETSWRQIHHSSTTSDILESFLSEWAIDVEKPRRSESGMVVAGSHPANAVTQQSVDDILNEYRIRESPMTLIDASNDLPEINVPPQNVLYYDSENLLQCQAFIDAKRKLRHVLGNIGTLPSFILCSKVETVNIVEFSSERLQLLRLLRVLLAEAINTREQVLSAHIREVIRVLNFFDDKGICKLLTILRDEHHERTAYVVYLRESRLTLLRLLTQIQRLDQRVKKEQTLTRECVVEFLIKFFLDNHGHSHTKLFDAFKQLQVQDERTDLLHKTLTSLAKCLSESPMWKDATEEMLDFANKTVERSVMVPIHNFAFYPNLDADIHRDNALHRSLSKLARTITPDHPMLHIPKELQGEAPWPSAQADIEILNAYKSPRDKLQCVVRACSTISNLIALAPKTGPASADDLTPVLVYVLIQANPPALLSNVQYVQNFCRSHMAGSDLYWWTQFTSAIEFIKTLL
ncbi:unnamed protein product, partial [Mesorhabditis belari]|uniref:Receptor-mediated endocytosis protein 6 n=1 Tax=Mesorhabditis belari TaxID=2138241 RepID=A0AAF3F0Y4_9BILA